MSPRRVVVVTGHSAAEHEAQIAALKASRDAREGDLVIYVRRFSDPARMEGERA